MSSIEIIVFVGLGAAGLWMAFRVFLEIYIAERDWRRRRRELQVDRERQLEVEKELVKKIDRTEG